MATITLEAQNERVPVTERIAYGFGDIAANFYLQMIAVYLMIFYTDSLGLSAVLAGSVIMCSRLFDGVNDVIIGYFIDKSGNYKKWILWGGLGAAILFVFMFYAPNINGQALKAIYAFLAFSIWTLAYTAYQIPYSALNATISANPQERVKLNSVRFAMILFPMQAITFVVPIFMPGITARFSGNSSHAYMFFAAVFGIIGFLCTVICVKGTKERVILNKKTDAEKITLKIAVTALLQNKPLFMVGLAWMAYALFINITGAASAYYFRYFLGDSKLLATATIVNLPILFLGMLSVPFFSKRFGAKKLLIICGIIIFALSPLRYFVGKNPTGVIVTYALTSFFRSFFPVLCFSLVGDTIEYGFKKTGKDVRVLNFSVFVFLQKLAMGFSATIVGALLAAVGYVANQTQTPQALEGIRVVFTIIPSCLILLAAVFMFFFDTRINKED